VPICAFVLGCGLGLGAALSAENPDVEAVDAAWGFVRRNFYDQTFNGQDWESAHSQYLERARRGESAEKLTREMISSLGDRYSRVVDAATFEQLMAYDPLGIGVVLTRNEDKDVFISSPPFANSAAAKAGLRQGDIVASIDGVAMRGQSLFSAMDRVSQGDAPQVRLSLRRGTAVDASTAWEVTLPRTRTATPQSKIEAGVVPGESPGGHRVGYLRLRSFGARSARDMSDTLASLRADGADELVLDLRGNLGGSFQAAMEVAELFLEPNAVATNVQTPAAGNQPLRVGKGSGVAAGGAPLVVLVDQQSASASEVLAAALRGNCRASLLGAKTYGKAAVQGVFGLPNKEAVALTVAQYSGPGGYAIGEGLVPDGFGPAGPLARAAAALGLPTALSPGLSPGEYAGIDFGPGRDEALRACRPAEAW